jgi:hypothetical protein
MATTTSDGVYIGNLPTLESGTGVSSTGDPISTASASPLLGTYSRAAGMQFFDDLVFETNSGNDIHIYENNITGQSAATLTYDLGAGPVASDIDTIADVSTNLYDGSGVEIGTGIRWAAIRLENGDTFLVPRNNTAVFFSVPRNIGSIEVTSFNNLGLFRDVLPNPEIQENFNLVCFANGVEIATPCGPRRIENLRPGDLVSTRDHGAQAIRWIGSRRLTRAVLAAHPRLRPICISAGALGPGVPATDLSVSRQHRVFVRSKIMQRMFGAAEALIPAFKLLDLPGCRLAEALEPVTYFHILCDRHEILFANGCPAESLLLGPQARQALSPEAYAEIAVLFPALVQPDAIAVPARPVVAGRRAAAAVSRHTRNRVPLIASPA